MSNLFVFTAGNESARQHLDVSIRQPIPSATVLNAFGADKRNDLEAIESQGHGFYAWGAKPGDVNLANWERMSPGDWVLSVFDNAYHYVARVLEKFRNANLASSVWKTDPDGQTWEYMYFLTKPREINVPLTQLTPDLHESYRGFTKISADRIQRIIQSYGSLDTFIQEKFLNSTIDLRLAEVLRTLHEEFLKSPDYSDWWNRLSSFLDDVAKASESLRRTVAFQHLLWDDNPVSAVGQGSIPVSNAIDDERFREWIAHVSMEKLPTDPDAAIDNLKTIRNGITERLKPFCARMPHLKIFRVLTAFFPRHFTCVADRSKLRKLHLAMFENSGGSGSIGRHANILHRLEEVLGPAPPDFPGLVRRITFPWYLYEKLPGSVEEEDDVEDEEDPLTELAKELLIDIESLATMRLLLERKKQVIFYGPPGTGKTYVAQRLAEAITGSKEKVEIVQFHPSYAYEDFVEGFRPTAGGFGLVSGPLKRIAEKARTDQSIHVLIIDEVNRGNVTKVFGELYFLLEYREKEIFLTYSREPFNLPENLRIIATMNTADRSIALMDAALRRRFYFFGFFPDSAPINGLLHRWLKKNNPQLVWLAEVVDLVNRKLADRHTAIGPSYFMAETLTEAEIKTIWTYSILPHLEEYFYGQPERLSEFELENLRREVSATGEMR